MMMMMMMMMSVFSVRQVDLFFHRPTTKSATPLDVIQCDLATASDKNPM